MPRSELRSATGGMSGKGRIPKKEILCHYQYMDQIVYILINEAMPGYVKIGLTGDLQSRIKQLSSTSVPVPFECFYAKRVKDARFVENRLQTTFSQDRVDSGAGREFFMIQPEQAAAALSLAEGEEIVISDSLISEQEKVAIEEIKKRRPGFNFSMVKIKPGSILMFSLDETITCKVHDSKKVEFNGEIVSLSDAAMQVLSSKGLNWKAVSGPGIWMYEGENLYERRIRMEGEDEPSLEEVERAGDAWISQQI